MANIKQNAKYGAIHIWVRNNKPKPIYCEICKKKSPCHVASKDGSYKRDINHYMWLCHSCHSKYDEMGKCLGNYARGLVGKKNPHWKGGKKKYQCVNCNKMIYRYISTVRNEKMVFCSRVCKTEHFKGKNLGKDNPNYRHGRYCQ